MAHRGQPGQTHESPQMPCITQSLPEEWQTLAGLEDQPLRIMCTQYRSQIR